MKHTMHYIIFGLPGAGKGVCAQALKEHKGFNHLSLGEYLRNEVRQNSPIGLFYKSDIDSGVRLIACETVWDIVKSAILTSIKDRKNLVIDGFPRTHKQLSYLEELLKTEKQVKIEYLYFQVDPELAIQRLLTRKTCSQCQHDYIMSSTKDPLKCDLCSGILLTRSTDNRETILKRIELFYSTTKEVIGRLHKTGLVRIIDSNQNLDMLAQGFISGEYFSNENDI